MRKFLFTSLLFLFPSVLLADTLSLTPPSTDLSMSYLATIFGVVDGVLHGTGSQILGTMFGAFNSIILVMASTILGYVLFVSILNTSHEGEFLGKKWSSIWVPLRTVAGVGLLLPKATGYSMIQILVLWVVVQGVGAADEVWNVALNYINHNGAIVEPVQSLKPDPKSGKADNSFLVGKAGSILKLETCMLAIQNALNRQNANTTSGTGPAPAPVPDFMSSLVVTGKKADGSNSGAPIDYSKDIGGYINFPGQAGLKGSAYNKYIGLCGNLNWNFIGKTGEDDRAYNPAQLTANDSASIAARQMTLDLGPLAKTLANSLVPPTGKGTVPITKLKADDAIFTPNVLIDTGEDYFGIVKPALRSLADDASKKYKEFINKAKDNGWILAGSYYYNMARLNQSIRNNTGTAAITDKLIPVFNPIYDKGSFNDINDDNVKINLKNNLPANNGVIDQYINAELSRADASDNPGSEPILTFPNNPSEAWGAGWLVKQVMNTIFPRVHKFTQELSDNINNKNMDPIFALASVGNGLVTMVEEIWAAILAIPLVISVVGGALSWIPIIGIGFAVTTIVAQLCFAAVMIVLMPLLSVWMGINLTLGAVLSYYVPLIPFFLFTFGAITWFAVVLEAVLAAPLVALGITHPEGHDFLGKAEQSIMLLASVFLRPMLMVFGLIFGIILSYVALSLFNRGFAIAIQFLNDYNGDIFNLIYQLAMMAIYTSAVLAIMNRCFAMIYEVPNKVLRWIGGPQESGHEESMLQGIRHQHDRDVGQIGQLVPSAQSASQTGSASSQLSNASQEAQQTSASSGGGTPPGGGGGLGGGGGASAGGSGAASTASSIPPVVP
ncbi:MAG: type IV secretion system protein DotA [Gammaproteobacteria bacterium]|nr:MAG: type IV secretion system protein DotA [Gammaproteobacteria bacterium]